MPKIELNPSKPAAPAGEQAIEQTVRALETLATLCQRLAERYLSPPPQPAAAPAALEQRLAALEKEFKTLVTMALPSMCQAVTEQIEALRQRIGQVSQDVAELAERQRGEHHAAVPQGGQDRPDPGAVAPVH